MTYRQALDYVLAFADYERSPADRVRYRDFNLERVRALLSCLGDPDESFGSVHVAGTKGKGSTSAMVASVLRAAGYRTGLYTSPHLHTIRERIAIDGDPVPEQEFAEGVQALEPKAAALNAQGGLGRLTTFELLTALAFLLFRRRGVQEAVVEVGMGGRLDATNVITPRVAAITNISLDHTDVLGESIAQIAFEKAAIIKPGIPVVTGPQLPEALAVIERTAAERGAPLTVVGRDVTWGAGEGDLRGQSIIVRSRRGERRLWMPLLGPFQRENAATAVAICDALVERGLRIPEGALRAGMAQVSWPGRLEVLATEPLTVADGAHNPHSVARLAEAVREVFSFERVIAIVGVGRTKDLGGMLDALAGLPVRVIATQSRSPLAAPAQRVLEGCWARGLPAELAPDTGVALARGRALAGPRDLVLATGSLFIVAEVREMVKGIEPERCAPRHVGAI
jgi:dihydrofolate synthase/folylpolyglutamate synthase